MIDGRTHCRFAHVERRIFVNGQDTLTSHSSGLSQVGKLAFYFGRANGIVDRDDTVLYDNFTRLIRWEILF
jgi:hypothetical protein